VQSVCKRNEGFQTGRSIPILNQTNKHSGNTDISDTDLTLHRDAKTTLQLMRAAREERIEQTRQRVRNATVKKGTVFMKARPKPSVNDEGEKVVAAYARVSTKSEEQVSSIENQTRYYTEKIEGTPNWSLHDIYADEGKSGTSMSKRTEFQADFPSAIEGFLEPRRIIRLQGLATSQMLRKVWFLLRGASGRDRINAPSSTKGVIILLIV
jgi:hypothetical protein